MEHRRQPAARNRNRRVNQNAVQRKAGAKKTAAKKTVAKSPVVGKAFLPNIAELIAYGEITVGVLHPIGCVATAADEHNSLAMLVRRRGEALAELLSRLDHAIKKALSEEIFTDEIN